MKRRDFPTLRKTAWKIESNLTIATRLDALGDRGGAAKLRLQATEKALYGEFLARRAYDKPYLYDPPLSVEQFLHAAAPIHVQPSAQ